MAVREEMMRRYTLSVLCCIGRATAVVDRSGGSCLKIGWGVRESMEHHKRHQLAAVLRAGFVSLLHVFLRNGRQGAHLSLPSSTHCPSWAMYDSLIWSQLFFTSLSPGRISSVWPDSSGVCSVGMGNWPQRGGNVTSRALRRRAWTCPHSDVRYPSKQAKSIARLKRIQPAALPSLRVADRIRPFFRQIDVRYRTSPSVLPYGIAMHPGWWPAIEVFDPYPIHSLLTLCCPSRIDHSSAFLLISHRRLGEARR